MDVVGEYNFYINDWLCSVIVEVLCSSNNLKGLREGAPLSITLDDEKTLLLELALDINHQSWEKLCGSLKEAAIHNDCDFVVLDLNENSLYVRPIKKVHLGLHIIGVEQMRDYSWSFRALIILVTEPEDYIDAHEVPLFEP